MQLVMRLIREHLTPTLIGKRKSLMYPEDVGVNKMYGHCYHSSETLYYIINTDRLSPMSAEDYRGEKHWWLQDGEKIYDVTADQYYSVGQEPPYSSGKKSRWYGWKQRPQQVSLNLMVKVLGTRLHRDFVTKS